MQALRDTCLGLGYEDVQTYIQSGNLVFQTEEEPAVTEDRLEKAILESFSLRIPIIARCSEAWPAIVASNPFHEASLAHPNHVMLCLSKLPPSPDAVPKLRERARHGELIEQTGNTIWIHYQEGVAISKLTPALWDRLVGSSVTARNWRTVLKLQEMVGLIV